jgi:hypothetical protein
MKSRFHKIARIASAALSAAALSGTAVSQPAHPPIVHGEPIDAPVAAQTPPPAAPDPTPSSPATPPVSLASQPAPATAAVAVTSTNSISAPVVWNAASLTRLGDYLCVGFDGLASFEYEAPDTALKGPAVKPDPADKFIPDYIKSLDGKKVIIKGFMIPLLVKEGKVAELLLMRNQSTCCYGVPPKITEFISVKMTGKGVPALMDTPVSLEGTLRVGTARENGFITEIYQMDGEKLVDDAVN